MNISELISWLSLIIRDLETAAAEYGVNHTDIVHEATQLQEQLCRGKQVTPAQLRALSARLWGARMRLAAQYGQDAPLMNDLAFLSNCLNYDADRLNDRWRYREWISAAESFVLPLVFIIPLLIVLCYMMKSGNSGGAELCAALAGAWCTGLTFLCLWAKDPVGLFWSLYSFIPLYFLWCDISPA
ncbi:hypothetical protein LH904_003305 [Escherichia coli]|nr:hypothetical protein [Escherichia coli]